MDKTKSDKYNEWLLKGREKGYLDNNTVTQVYPNTLFPSPFSFSYPSYESSDKERPKKKKTKPKNPWEKYMDEFQVDKLEDIFKFTSVPTQDEKEPNSVPIQENRTEQTILDKVSSFFKENFIKKSSTGKNNRWIKYCNVFYDHDTGRTDIIETKRKIECNSVGNFIGVSDSEDYINRKHRLKAKRKKEIDKEIEEERVKEEKRKRLYSSLKSSISNESEEPLIKKRKITNQVIYPKPKIKPRKIKKQTNISRRQTTPKYRSQQVSMPAPSNPYNPFFNSQQYPVTCPPYMRGQPHFYPYPSYIQGQLPLYSPVYNVPRTYPVFCNTTYLSQPTLPIVFKKQVVRKPLFKPINVKKEYEKQKKESTIQRISNNTTVTSETPQNINLQEGQSNPNNQSTNSGDNVDDFNDFDFENFDFDELVSFNNPPVTSKTSQNNNQKNQFNSNNQSTNSDDNVENATFEGFGLDDLSDDSLDSIDECHELEIKNGENVQTNNENNTFWVTTEQVKKARRREDNKNMDLNSYY